MQNVFVYSVAYNLNTRLNCIGICIGLLSTPIFTLLTTHHTFGQGALPPQTIQCTVLLGRRNTVYSTTRTEKTNYSLCTIRDPTNAKPYCRYSITLCKHTSEYSIRRVGSMTRFLARIFGQMCDQLFGQVFDQGFWEQKIQFTLLPGRRHTETEKKQEKHPCIENPM